MIIFAASRSKRGRLHSLVRALPVLIIFHLLAIILLGSALALEDPANRNAGSFNDPFSCQYSCSGNDPLSSLEDLLRSEAQLISSFEILLGKTDTNLSETMTFLDSFEDLLRRQTTLYSGFEKILKSQWYRLNCKQQRKFLNSFEDLLQREVRLFAGFNSSLERNWKSLSHSEKVKLLDSFEDLLRRQTKLFKSFEDLYMMTQGGLTVEKHVNKTCICGLGDTVEYWYVVKNWYNQTIKNVSVVDDRLGEIARNITLGSYENRTFYKKSFLTGNACNTARAYGEGPCGEKLFDESNTICVILCPISGNNSDIIVVGRQFAFTSGSDPPVALNNIDIKKKQKIEGIKLNNTGAIRLGDQKAYSIANAKSGGETSNTIKIVANQE